MSDGSPHPDAIEPVIIGANFVPQKTIGDITILATGHRFAARVSLRDTLFREERGKNLFIWDWRTGQKYFVSVIPSLFLAVASELDLLSRIIFSPD